MPTFSDVFSLATLDGANGFKVEAGANGDFTGRSVASAGDINGDGYDDLLIGAPSSDASGRTDAGQVYVIFGKAGGFPVALAPATLDGSNGFRILGAASGDAAGASAASAGDVNGDGFDDILVGASSADPGGLSFAGSAYVIFGKAGGFSATLDLAALSATNGFRLDGQAGSAFAGQRVAGVGDFNRDGFDDFVVAATGMDSGGARSGAAYVVFGKASGFSSAQPLAGLNGTSGFRIDGGVDEVLGWSVGGAGDLNGDGFADLVLGAPDYSNPIGLPPIFSSSPGAAYVIFGRAQTSAASVTVSSQTGALGVRLDGTASSIGDQAGWSVGSAGDINGDGVGDLIVGANWFDPNGLGNAGAAFVVYGKVGGFSGAIALAQLDGTNGFRLNGAASADFAGAAVAGIGDINGDGYDDLVVGAEGADPGGRQTAGSAYVIFGKAAAFAPVVELSAIAGSAGFRIDGLAAGDLLGNRAGPAGDLNGDGVDDLAIGAERADGSFSGAAYVIFGKSASGATAGADALVGAAGADGLKALAGADSLQGLGGDDRLDGGAGADKALYAGAASQYDWWSRADGSWRVKDLRAGSPEGSDTLIDVESLQFSDKTVKILGLTTAEELTAAYENVLRATAMGGELTFLNGLITAVNGSTKTLSAAIGEIVAKADQTTAVAAMSYQFFLGFVPSKGGFDYLVSPQGPNPNNINSAYYQFFNIENRYINFAVNLGKNGEGAAPFLAEYGGKTLFQATKDAYMEVFGGTVTDGKINTILDSSVGGMTRAQYFATYGGDGVTGIGTKAAMVGWLLTEAAKADIGQYARSSNAFLTDLADGAETLIDLVGAYGQADYVFNG
jgi:hypothetical protein